jgi:hypothetical protein
MPDLAARKVTARRPRYKTGWRHERGSQCAAQCRVLQRWDIGRRVGAAFVSRSPYRDFEATVHLFGADALRDR